MSLHWQWPREWNPQFVAGFADRLERAINTAMEATSNNQQQQRPFQGKCRVTDLSFGQIPPHVSLTRIETISPELTRFEVNISYEGDASVRLEGIKVNVNPMAAVPIAGFSRENFIGFQLKLHSVVISGVFQITIIQEFRSTPFPAPVPISHHNATPEGASKRRKRSVAATADSSSTSNSPTASFSPPCTRSPQPSKAKRTSQQPPSANSRGRANTSSSSVAAPAVGYTGSSSSSGLPTPSGGLRVPQASNEKKISPFPTDSTSQQPLEGLRSTSSSTYHVQQTAAATKTKIFPFIGAEDEPATMRSSSTSFLAKRIGSLPPLVIPTETTGENHPVIPDGPPYQEEEEAVEDKQDEGAVEHDDTSVSYSFNDAEREPNEAASNGPALLSDDEISRTCASKGKSHTLPQQTHPLHHFDPIGSTRGASVTGNQPLCLSPSSQPLDRRSYNLGFPSNPSLGPRAGSLSSVTSLQQPPPSGTPARQRSTDPPVDLHPIEGPPPLLSGNTVIQSTSDNTAAGSAHHQNTEKADGTKAAGAASSIKITSQRLPGYVINAVLKERSMGDFSPPATVPAQNFTEVTHSSHQSDDLVAGVFMKAKGTSPSMSAAAGTGHQQHSQQQGSHQGSRQATLLFTGRVPSMRYPHASTAAVGNNAAQPGATHTAASYHPLYRQPPPARQILGDTIAHQPQSSSTQLQHQPAAVAKPAAEIMPKKAAFNHIGAVAMLRHRFTGPHPISFGQHQPPNGSRSSSATQPAPTAGLVTAADFQPNRRSSTSAVTSPSTTTGNGMFSGSNTTTAAAANGKEPSFIRMITKETPCVKRQVQIVSLWGDPLKHFEVESNFDDAATPVRYFVKENLRSLIEPTIKKLMQAPGIVLNLNPVIPSSVPPHTPLDPKQRVW